MRVAIWGTRGSLPAPGGHTARYGGNTSCVEVRAAAEAVVVLDAGSALPALGNTLVDDAAVRRIDVLLSHLHMDHIIGLGFFGPLYRPEVDIHLWGPASTVSDLRGRLARYLSPPLFPVRLRDLPARLELHDVPLADFDLPGLHARADLVCHPGPTVGFRLDDGRHTVTYLPDHEPALGVRDFPGPARWTSGFALAAEVDLLIHDAQYDDAEYLERVGWGHSSIRHAIAFARLARARRLVAFHHDPMHDDHALDRLYADVDADGISMVPAREGDVFELGPR